MKHLLVCIGLIAAFASGLASAAEWTFGIPMNTPRGGLGAAVDQCGNIYAAGGQISWCPSELTNTVEKFDGKAWSYVAPMSTTREEFPLVCIGDFLYAIGGKTGGMILASVERYDITTDTWDATAVPDLNVARVGSGAVADSQGRVYVIGGVGLDEEGNPIALGSVEVFDLARPELGWTFGPPLNVPRRSAGIAIDGRGRIYAIGGGGLVEHLDTVERFDPCKPDAGWVILEEFILGPVSNADQAVTGADGRIYVAGGWLPGFTNRVVRFDPESETWQEWVTLNTPRVELALVLGKDGRIFAIGGASSGCPDALASVEVLDTTPCPGDLNGDGVVDHLDLLEVVHNFGTCNSGPVQVSGELQP